MIIWKPGREKEGEQPPADVPQVTGPPPVEHMDKAMRIELLNQTRAKHGLPPIELGRMRIKRA